MKAHHERLRDGGPIAYPLGMLPPPMPGALCAQSDPEAWFPEKGGSTRMAKRICHRCPHRTECADWAIETGQRYGVWGGMSERERRAIRSAQSPEAA